MTAPHHPARRSLARLGTAGVAALLATGLAGPVAAHGTVGSEFAPPLPLAFFLAGAGAAVALTAGLLGLRGAVPDGERALARIDAARWRLAASLARAGFLALAVAAVVHGLLGRQVASDNLATVAIWPLWLAGLAVLAVVAGSPWRTLSPWRTTYDWLCRLEGGEIRTATLPARVGVWPALVGFLLVVGVVANLTVLPRRPAATAGLVAAGWALMVAGGVAFGSDWYRRADPLAVLFDLLGRVAPLSVEPDGTRRRLVLRPPWRATARPVGGRAVAAFVVAAVYTVSFDGFVETPEYQTIRFAVRGVVGTDLPVAVGLYLAGFAAFLVVFWVVARVAGELGGLDRPAPAVAGTLLPIAAAYEVAHSYPFVLANLGRLPATLGGPAVEPLAWLSVPVFWGSQVVLIVLGHVVAVVAAHLAIASRVHGRRRALLAHAPLVLLMVGYTVLSLWIVSRPVVA